METNKHNFKNHHAKPFRKRHLSAFTVSIVLSGFMLLQLGILQGINRAEPQPVLGQAPVQTSTKVVSSYGFSLTADGNQFVVSGDKQTQVTIKPRPGTVDRSDAAANMSVRVNPDKALFASLLKSPANSQVPAQQVAVQLFPPTLDKRITTKIIAVSDDTIGGAPVYKTTYELTPNFKGGKTYAIVWSGVSEGRAYAVTVSGLVGTAVVPPVFKDVFASLQIASTQQVKGEKISLLPEKAPENASELDPKYLSDALSPAVVKIYHVVCGALSVQNRQVANDTCTGFTGSGFMATPDGYVATNGHVVVYSAQDALVDLLVGNPQALAAYMRGIGMSGDQIASVGNNPVELASVIAKIYDIPDEQLNFAGNKNLTLVALGSTPPRFDTLKTSKDLEAFARDRGEIRVAKLVAYDYSAKDKLNAIANPRQGFTSSDVAILKIDVQNAPTIEISKDLVVQNQQVLVLGFPGDADNQLTDNSQISPSATSGVVSSIRQAAGKNGRLYQSDADASHGNSGGPAIDASGKVIGLLTYRAPGDQTGNAAKSYIRDIADLTALASSKNISLTAASSTQKQWQDGLQLYSRNHFVAALTKFAQVQNNYPSHRLVNSYIGASQTAIAEGRNVAQAPVGWLVAGMAAAFGLAVISVGFIARHHGTHQKYKLFHADVAAAKAKLHHVVH